MDAAVNVHMKYWSQQSMYIFHNGFSCPSTQKHWIQLPMYIWHSGVSSPCTHELLDSAVHVHMNYWIQLSTYTWIKLSMCTWNTGLSCPWTHEILDSAVYVHMTQWIQLSLCTGNTGFSCPCAHEILDSVVHVHMKYWIQLSIYTWTLGSKTCNLSLSIWSSTHLTSCGPLIEHQCTLPWLPILTPLASKLQALAISMQTCVSHKHTAENMCHY